MAPHYYYGNLLAALGRFDDAVAEPQRALDLDPLSPNTRVNRLFTLYLARRYDEAIAAFQKMTPIVRSGPTTLAGLGFAYAMAGRRDDALKVLKPLEEASKHEYVSTYDVALLFLALGDTDRAFALFSKAYDDHSSFLPFIKIDARLDGVRSDPRLNELVRRMNFPAAAR